MTTNLNPKISVIVSVYKAERFIRQKIEDLLEQSVIDELEIIIINSGSPENEDEIIRAYAKKHSQIVYIHTVDRETIYKAWNRGIGIAKGKYITNSNVDDRLAPNALEVLCTALDNNPDVVLVYADQYISFQENQKFNEISKAKHFRWSKYNKLTLLESCITGPQPMWRASIHSQYNIQFNENLEVAGDYDFSLKVSQYGRLLKINKILGVYYLSPSQSNREHQNRALTESESNAVRTFHAKQYLSTLPVENIVKIRRQFHLLNKIPRLIYTAIKLLVNFIFNQRLIQSLHFSKWFSATIDNYLINPEPNCTDGIYHDTQDQDRESNSSPIAVSVIIPTYNRPELLTLALESLKSQTFKKFEVIVVNNGNLDVSELVKSFSCFYSVQYLTSHTAGNVSVAKNLGLSVSKGKYICYLDDDDWYEPLHIETLYNAIHNSEFGLVYSDALVQLQEMQNEKIITTKKFVEYSKNYSYNLLLIKDYIFTPCVIHRRACYEILGGFNPDLTTDEDWDLWLRFAKNYSFKHIAITTCNVRRLKSREQLTKNWALMFKNAMKVYSDHKFEKWYNPVVKLGQLYYLFLRKSRALRSKNVGNNNYY